MRICPSPEHRPAQNNFLDCIICIGCADHCNTAETNGKLYKHALMQPTTHASPQAPSRVQTLQKVPSQDTHRRRLQQATKQVPVSASCKPWSPQPHIRSIQGPGSKPWTNLWSGTCCRMQTASSTPDSFRMASSCQVLCHSLTATPTHPETAP